MAKEFTFEIVSKVATLSSSGEWSTELNVVSWNGNKPKLDIRPWNEIHDKCGKGITLTQSEAETLARELTKFLQENQ